MSSTAVKKIEKDIGQLPLPKISTNVWWNLAISIGGVILMLFLFKKALKELGLLSAEEAADKLDDVVDNALKVLEQSQIQPNYGDFQYQSWADAAYEGMKYSNIADNDGDVIDVAKHMLNDADVVKWAEAFGVRRLFWFGLPDGPKKTLFQALSSDLKDKTKRAINADWAAKGIKTRI